MVGITIASVEQDELLDALDLWLVKVVLPMSRIIFEPISANAVCCEGGRVAVGHGSRVDIWDVNGLRHVIKKCARAIGAMELIPGQDMVVTGGQAATGVLRAFQDETRVSMKGPVGAIHTLTVAPDASAIVMAKRRWNLRGEPGESEMPYLCTFLADSQRLLATARDFDTREECTQLCDLDGIQLRVVEKVTLGERGGPPYAMNCLATDRQGHHFATARSGEIRVYDDQGTRLASATHGEHKTSGLAFSPNGSVLASASWNGSISLWSSKDLTPLATLQGFAPFSGGSTLSFLSEQVVLTLGEGRVPQLWNLQTGRRVSLVAWSASKWAALDDAGQYMGSPSGLRMLRIGEPAEDSSTWNKASDPTLTLSEYFEA